MSFYVPIIKLVQNNYSAECSNYINAFLTRSIYQVSFVHSVVEMPFHVPILKMFFSREVFFVRSVVKMQFHVPIIKRSNYECVPIIRFPIIDGWL